MKVKRKIIIFLLILTSSLLIYLNIKNNAKTTIYFLNTKSKELTIGNVLTLSFICGISISSIFYTIYDFKYEKINKEIDKNLNNNIDEYYSNTTYLEDESSEERPPERDLRDSQPTISVNYRVLNQNQSVRKEQRNIVNQEIDEESDEWGVSKDDW